MLNCCSNVVAAVADYEGCRGSRAAAASRNGVLALLHKLEGVAIHSVFDGDENVEAALAHAIPELKQLIACGGDIDSADEQGMTPCMLAAAIGWSAGVEQLIQAQADVNCVGRGHGDASAIFLAVSNNHVDVVKLLLEAQANPAQPVKPSGNTPLCAAAALNVEVVRLLIQRRADVNQGPSGPPIMMAAFSGNAAALTELLAARADISLGNLQLSTALHSAAEANSAECLAVLLSSRADVHQANKQGKTPLHVADGAEAAKTLIEFKADVERAASDGATPMLAAAQWCRLEVVEVLVAARASVNRANFAGVTPLQAARAALVGAELVAALTKHGATSYTSADGV